MVHSATCRPVRGTAPSPVGGHIAGSAKEAGNLGAVPSLPPISGNGSVACPDQVIDDARNATVCSELQVVFDDWKNVRAGNVIEAAVN